MDKLKLNGEFQLESAVFTSAKAGERLQTLSNRASGISKAKSEQGQGSHGPIASEMSARFQLDNGQVSFSRLAFSVPGANIQLAGIYNLKSSAVNMKGKFQMRATLSQTQSGVKQTLLKPIDPLFKKNGAGFEVPFSITGTRNDPEIGISAFHKRFNIH